MDSPNSRHARQVMQLALRTGETGLPVLDPAIAGSWQRCLQQYRLEPDQARAPVVLEAVQLRERQQRLQEVLEISRGEMGNLHRQLAGSGQAVLLTDAAGIILDSVTQPAERRAFEQAGLWLGADWSEVREGTNGIGTCLVERRPLTIHQHEHFRSRHTGLTCSASPVFGPQGELLAVLDVSSARPDTTWQSQFHTMALVGLAAKLIETGCFLRRYDDQWLLRFHAQAEYIGQCSEGLLAFDGNGRVQAVNQGAINLLGLSREQLLGRTVEEIFDCRLRELLGRAALQPVSSWPLFSQQGQALFAVLRGQPRRPWSAPGRGALATPGVCLDDPRLQEALRRALRVYERDVPLLVGGETGVGKEAFARALHQVSSRGGKPFVALNCAALPESLIESELFGYRGGSFTGARKEGMRGKLQQADGGTLFLDEIGDMPLALQTRLLRVLEERQVEPLGGLVERIDVRVISASLRNLQQRVASGQFREDLYYRLNGLVIELPPLREREDLPQVLEFMLGQEGRGQSLQLDEEARRALLSYHWPGNLRQLRHVLRMLVALAEDGRIGRQDLPPELLQAASAGVIPADAPAPLASAERAALLAVLQAQRWHITRAAEQLGLSRNTLYRKLRKYGISPRRE